MSISSLSVVERATVGVRDTRVPVQRRSRVGVTVLTVGSGLVGGAGGGVGGTTV